MVPSLNEETESNDVCLRPRKVRMTVSMSGLLGRMGDVLGNKFSASVQKNKVAIPDSATSPPPTFAIVSPIDLRSDSTFGSALGSPGGSIRSKKPLA